MAATNAAPKLDFLGLSPAVVHSLRTVPFGPRQRHVTLRLKEGIKPYAAAPILEIALDFMGRIANDGPLKATARGNLPRAVVRDINDRLIAPMCQYPMDSPMQEAEVADLYKTRKVMELADLIELSKGRFRLTTSGSDLLARVVEREDASRLYERLLYTFLYEFYWLFYTRYTDAMGQIQVSALFCLYLLHKKAADWVDTEMLARHFTRAFPAIARESDAERPGLSEYWNGETETSSAFRYLFLEIFCRYFGLVKIRTAPESTERDPLGAREVKTTDLFRKLLNWRV
jgi:hypothetical protein